MGSWLLSSDGGATFADLSSLFFDVKSAMGTGMVPVKNLSTPLAQQPGEEYQSTKIDKRPFTLRGSFNVVSGANKENYHSRKAVLLKALNAQAGTRINARPTPVQLKYTGAVDDKIIHCFYEGGLEDEPLESEGFTQQNISLRFVAYDPFFYGTGESSQFLDNIDAATFTVVAGKIDGLWDNLGPPNASGTYTSVNAIAEDSAYVYFGGNFVNFDNIAAADYIVRMNKVTGVYSALGSGLSAAVNDIAIGPSGLLYAVGVFQNAGGVAAADYIATWNGTAWAAVGAPNSGGASITSINAVGIAADGNVYVGGLFSNLAGVAAADGVAKWDGSAWTALGSGTTGNTVDIAAGAADDIYYVGTFTSMGGVSDTNFIAKWNGSAWVSVKDVDTGTFLSTVILDDAGNVYVGGDITSIGGVTVSGVAMYNGTSWVSLAAGPGTYVQSLAFDSSGLLYAGGSFTTIAPRLAVWNGSTWARLDITLPSTPVIEKILVSLSGDLYLGFTSSGNAYYAGNVTVAYAGTAVAYPRVTLLNTFSTPVTIVRLANATTGAVIYLNYTLLVGETLTLDFRPFSDTPLTAVSSFFGPVPGAILGGSSTGQFYLTPGRGGSSQDNVITLYGTSDVLATLYYTATYLSQD